jgi:AAA family ATP:ADP antiporter
MRVALADVRPEERRGVASAFLTLVGVLAGHTLLETARDALFLARLPASRLPWMYLAIAGIAFLFSRVSSRRLDRLLGARSLSVLLAGSAVVTLAFWAIGSSRHPVALYALYVWAGLFGTAAGVRFWLLLSEIYTVTQAKRVYRLIGAGSIVGAIVGASLATLLATWLPVAHLLPAAALLMLLTAVAPAWRLRRTPGDGGVVRGGMGPLSESLQTIVQHPYVAPLAGLVLASTMALTLADYIFKAQVAESVAPGDLGRFFAVTNVALNVLALLVQIVVAGPLLARVGVHRSLWLLPGLLIAGALGFLVGGGLRAALWLKGSDGSMRHSLNRTATELLYVPLPDSLRNRVKAFIDVVGQRGGQALASVLILAPVAFVPRKHFLALTLVVLAVLWIAAAAHLQRHYLDLFRSALREGAIVTRIDLPGLDLSSLEALFAALNSRDDAEVLGALDLLAEEDKTRLVPALVLYHPSKAVVLRAFELFVSSGRADFLPVADRLLRHADPEIRAAALRARTFVEPDVEVLRTASSDMSALVSATALVGLVSGGHRSPDDDAAFDALIASRSHAAALALARAISLQPSPVFEKALIALAESPAPDVLSEVARAMAAVKNESFLPVLLPMLAQREVRGAARAALLAHGSQALAFLDTALDDRALPQEIRRHVPRTIMLFSPEAAAPLLLGHLLEEPDGLVRFKILRGLGRLRTDNPGLPLDQRVLEEATARTLSAALRLVHWRHILEEGAAASPERRTPGFELLTTLLRDKEIHAVERLFRLLGLQYRGEDFARIHRGYRSSNAKVRAGSRELLTYVVGARFRSAVLALLDDGPVPERLAVSQAFYDPPVLDYAGLLALMLDESSESLRCIVSHHIAELGLRAFRPRLVELHARERGLFAIRVFEHALAILDAPGRPELQHA